MASIRDRVINFGLRKFAQLAAASISRPDKVSGYITPRAARRAQRDIKDWRTAQQKAEHPEKPRRNLLVNIYEELVLDGHLQGQIMGRKSRAIGGGFSVINSEGEIDTERTALLEKPWFYELLGHFWDANLYGHTLLEVDEFEPLSGGKGGIKRLRLINRRNVVPEQGLVLKNETDDGGLEYRESEYDPWLFETDKTHDLGTLNYCAAYILYKRYALASWSEFTEIYGIPPRLGKTDIRDKELVKQMSQALKDLGSSASGVIDLEDDIIFLDTKGSRTSDVFEKLVNSCNSEVSKILNGTVIGEASEGGSRSKEEVGERTAALIARDDRKELEQLINSQVIPKLIQHGYPLEGCYWSLDDDVNMDGLFDKVDKLLQHGEVDPDFIEEKWGIPWQPRNGAAGFFG